MSRPDSDLRVILFSFVHLIFFGHLSYDSFSRGHGKDLELHTKRKINRPIAKSPETYIMVILSRLFFYIQIEIYNVCYVLLYFLIMTLRHYRDNSKRNEITRLPLVNFISFHFHLFRHGSPVSPRELLFRGPRHKCYKFTI